MPVPMMKQPLHLQREPVCQCHADDSLYGSLFVCPSCGHRSFDSIAMSCERRRCGYAMKCCARCGEPFHTRDLILVYEGQERHYVTCPTPPPPAVEVERALEYQGELAFPGFCPRGQNAIPRQPVEVPKRSSLTQLAIDLHRRLRPTEVVRTKAGYL